MSKWPAGKAVASPGEKGLAEGEPSALATKHRKGQVQLWVPSLDGVVDKTHS